MESNRPDSLLNSFPDTPLKPARISSPKILIFAAIVILSGLATGFVLSRVSGPTAATPDLGERVESESEVGIKDTKTFSDDATGTLEEGGLNGEGTHKLIRPGGANQTVYLISSVVDLQEFVGKKVQVFGQTLKAQRVGWLMDVGRIKILE